MTAAQVGREHHDQIGGSVCRRPGHLLHSGLDVAAVDLSGLHIETGRRDHVVSYGDDDHSSLAKHRAVRTGPCQCHSLHSLSPSTAQARSSAVKSGMLAKMLDQLANTWLLPPKPRLGCAG